MLDDYAFALLTPRSDTGSHRLSYRIDIPTRRFTITSSNPVDFDLAVGFLLETPVAPGPVAV